MDGNSNYTQLQTFMTRDILNHHIAIYEALLKLFDIDYNILTLFHLYTAIRIILRGKDEIVPPLIFDI